MDVTNTNTIRSILMVVVLAATISLLIHTSNFSVGLCFTSVLYTLVVFFRDYIFKIKLQSLVGTIYIAFQLVMSLIIIVWSESFIAQIYGMILIAEYTFYHSLKRSILFTTICYIAIMLCVVS